MAFKENLGNMVVKGARDQATRSFRDTQILRAAGHGAQ